MGGLEKRHLVYYYVYREVYNMRTNVVLNDELVEAAFKYAKPVKTKRELIEVALKEFVDVRKRKNIRELRGKIKFRDNYDHKALRK
jgi:Arc/MetJ family transcription regulator